jgi:CHAD domain-containing protein
MEIERNNAQKPLKKLRKSLKRLDGEPSSEEVHSLRTQTRRLEAIVDALAPKPKKQTRRLLKTVTPLRKAAGDVRDMDVLAGHLLSLPQNENNEALGRLVEHLGEMRVENARELRHTVDSHRKDARRSLKKYSKLIGKQFNGDVRDLPADSAPARLAAELQKWPSLNEGNIHDFRIKVKQLRYMLQLARDVDSDMVGALGKVKDQVGDWHDWQELSNIAHSVLNPKSDGEALREIEGIGKQKFQQALAVANSLRQEYFAEPVAPAKPVGLTKKPATPRSKKKSSRPRKSRSK